MTTPIQSVLATSIQGLVSPANQGVKAAGSQFAGILTKMLDKTSQSQATSDDLQKRLQLDDPTVSVEKSVLASNEASLNLEFTLQTRNKLIKAYQDITSMPV